jgi:hypothetical protein
MIIIGIKNLKKEILRFAVIFFLVQSFACSLNRKNGPDWVNQYDVTWNTQSENSSASMPLVGGNIGCNVWVENDELLFYFSSPGAREENGALMKFGRIRIAFEPNIFKDSEFEQKLKLSDGAVYIRTKSKEIGKTKIKLWAEIGSPVVHTEIESDKKLDVMATYENWRTEKLSLPLDADDVHQQRYISWSNCPWYPGDVFIYPDTFEVADNSIVFYHRMREDQSYFPKLLEQQKLTEIKNQLWDPVTNLTFGGILTGDNLKFSKMTNGFYAQTDFTGWQYKTEKSAKSVKLKIYTHIAQTETAGEWKEQLLDEVQKHEDDKILWQNNLDWWKQFWERSYIKINQDKGSEDPAWQLGRNYNIFRYMLVSGFFGNEPSMFNGGVLTFDPKFDNRQKLIFESNDTSVTCAYTPDYRRWGAGFTAQNQRLLYWPMLKSGDFDGILPELDFYKNTLATTKAKVKYYWGHDGCCCEEQNNATGLLGMAEFGWADNRVTNFRHRPKDYEIGVSNNPYIGRLYDSQLEHAFMILQYRKFSGNDISAYLPFVEQAVIFYDEHYRMREKKRTGNDLDGNGKLVIYPSNTLENHPNAKNPTAVLAGLKAVLNGLLELPDSLQSAEAKSRWKNILATVPDYPMGEITGYKYFKPAENYERNHPAHNPEMYGLYPYQLYGLGMPDLELQENTYLYAASEEYRTSSGFWSQSVIHAARLGMRERAGKLIFDKLGNGPYRFPSFFPGGDYSPDHNVGGSGMIGLQEMVMQTHDGRIRLLPACPKDWDVEYKLHAPENTVVEVSYKDGKINHWKVTPGWRKKDVVVD